MADVQQKDHGKKGSKKPKPKKHSTRIDMTPMVDVAFLLLTFFVLTTRFSNPRAMELNMPDKPDTTQQKPPQVKESRVLTLLLGENDSLFWYYKVTNPKVNLTNYSDEGIRKVIFDKQEQAGYFITYNDSMKVGQTLDDATKKTVTDKGKSADGLIVIIKALPKSKYKNLVDVLDEMLITQTSVYVIVPPTPTDQQLLNDWRSGANRGNGT